MSGFDSQNRKKWGDYESDSDQELEENKHEPILEQHNREENEDEDEDEEEDHLNLSLIGTAVQGRKQTQKSKCLSKKEKLELKKKELEDLNSLLAEFQETNGVDDGENIELIHDVDSIPLAEQKVKRKKKKKSAPLSSESSNTNTDILENAKITKKIPSKPKAVDPVKLALEEAMKSSAKKKKRDKSKFSETSY